MQFTKSDEYLLASLSDTLTEYENCFINWADVLDDIDNDAWDYAHYELAGNGNAWEGLLAIAQHRHQIHTEEYYDAIGHAYEVRDLNAQLQS